MLSMGMALAEQFDRAWDMLRKTISRFDADRWREGERTGLEPARWAFHAILAVDSYSRSGPEDAFWKPRFGTDWDRAAEMLPSQQQLLEYLGDVQAALRTRLMTATDAEMMARSPFPWTGDTVLQFMLYALRHTQYHTGELGMLLRLRGAAETEWR